MEHLSITAVFLLVTVGQCMACMYVPRPLQGVVRRMDQATVAFRGKVTNINDYSSQDQGTGSIPLFTAHRNGFYEATFDVDCIYKGELGKSVTVLRFGDDGAQCSSADVELGQEYVVLARVTSDGYQVDNINIQSGAVPVTAPIIYRVEKKYDCYQPNA